MKILWNILILIKIINSGLILLFRKYSRGMNLGLLKSCCLVNRDPSEGIFSLGTSSGLSFKRPISRLSAYI